MTDEVTVVYALFVDGPMAGEIYDEMPVGHPQLTFWGHRYRLTGVVNGVAQYRFVAPS